MGKACRPSRMQGKGHQAEVLESSRRCSLGLAHRLCGLTSSGAGDAEVAGFHSSEVAGSTPAQPHQHPESHGSKRRIRIVQTKSLLRICRFQGLDSRAVRDVEAASFWDLAFHQHGSMRQPQDRQSMSELWQRIQEEIRQSTHLVLYRRTCRFASQALIEAGMALAMGLEVRIVEKRLLGK